MKGFKVVKEDLVHNGFKYQEGLNVDTLPFRDEGSCVPGGLYFFTDIKDVVNWISYGVYLYEVEVPEDHQYVLDPVGGKYRASGLILSNPLDLRKVDTWVYLSAQGISIKYNNVVCWAAGNGHLEVVKFLISIGADNDDALRWAAEGGHLGVVKYLVSQGADIHACKDFALRRSAEYGHLEVVKFLVEKGADIHTFHGYVLRLAAENGHLDVVKYLVEKGADIHVNNEDALYRAAYNGHLDVVEYLKSLGANYEGI